MNKKQISAVAVSALIASVVGIYYSQPCISPKMIDYEVSAQEGYSFRIIAPDNHYCVITGAVMTKADYVRMQNNVGIFTVLDKTPVTAKPTYEYCEIAKWLYAAHTETYPDIQAKYHDLMLPLDCRNTTIKLIESMSIYDNITPAVAVPEFGSIAMMILAISIISIVAVQRKSNV